MCCFNGPVDHVWGTRIFVGANAGKQITVYSANMFGSAIEMVLPVRTHGALKIEFIDMKEFESFFAMCELAFPPTPDAPRYTHTLSLMKGVEYLEVEQVGDYKVSFAPSRDDLSRADPRVFKLSSRLNAVLSAHYPPEQYGFVIYKPDHGGAMHPLAYRHAIQPGKPLFVPTRHEHGHEGPPDWDHAIYHQGNDAGIARTNADVSPETAWHTFSSERLGDAAVPAELDLSQYLRKLTRKGESYPNGDIEIAQVSHSGNIAGAVAGGAIVLGAGSYYMRTRRKANEEKQ